MSITPKENYLMLLRGEIPEYIPSFYDDSAGRFNEELLTPQACPDGPIVTSLGVTYVGSPEMNNGAMPKPGEVLIEDITKWRDILKLPDLSDFDWEDYYTKKTKDIDRKNKYVPVVGGDYFLSLISLTGFENAMLALYEEPDEVKELLERISEFYIMVFKNQLLYAKPDTLTIMDDDSAQHTPFFSVDAYREFFKPFQKLHCDLALENNMPIERHDCGRCEQFIPDWLEMGISAWNPAQTANDLVGIKKTYGNKLAICGGWDAVDYLNCYDLEILRRDLTEYVDTFAPGGGFSFSAMMPPDPNNPKSMERSEFVKNFYYEYVRDYYKTH